MFKLANKGSATIEMCFIMPLVVIISFMIIMLFIDTINDGIVQGSIYENIYQFNAKSDFAEVCCTIEKNIKDIYVGENNLQIKIRDTRGIVSVRAKDIAGNKKEYKTEYYKCSGRLRGWQIYGNIVQD